jgi:hypothetical protein
MAKWGEGDPRWIVEDRPDATNVNNWHWTEKNADKWSRDKLNEIMLVPIVMDDVMDDDDDDHNHAEEEMEIEMVEMDKCEGEARANNRKAKLIFFYEWEMQIKWRAKAKAKASVSGKAKAITKETAAVVAEGKVIIPNLSEEHTDMKDVDIEVEISTDSGQAAGKDEEAGRKAKEFLRVGGGAKEIRRRLQAYVNALKEEYSQGKQIDPETRFDLPSGGAQRSP